MALSLPLTAGGVVQRRLRAQLSTNHFLYSACYLSSATSQASSGSCAPAYPRDAGLLFGATVKKKKDLGQVSIALSGQFYQRSLPAAQIPFSSSEGRQLFREALGNGHMENYFFLAEQFRTQDEPTFCGLTTLAMVLNSLRIDPMQTWKGAWRWISEDMLSCCTTPEKVREEGLSYDMFRSLALCQGARVVSQRAPELSASDVAKADFLNNFRETVRRISSSSERECLVVCYSRELLGQTGAGHFSPIGGYHEGSDSVLIMDVARFKYPPHWAPVHDVVQAMTQIDPDTGKTRGFLHMRLAGDSNENHAVRPLYNPLVPAAAGRRLVSALTSALASQCTALASEPATTVAVRRWLHAASTVEPQVVKRLLQVGDSDALLEVLTRLLEMPLYVELCDAYVSLVSSGGGFRDEFPPLRLRDGGSTEVSGAGLSSYGELWILLLLLLPQHLRSAVSEEVGHEFIPTAIARTVKGPWALPLEALRESLGHALPDPNKNKNPCRTL